MELPMNLLMKRLGANVTLPIMVILWGVVCACQGTGRPFPPQIAGSDLSPLVLGAVHSYRGLLVCRFFLGALEGMVY
jgi:hypothetical protein